MSAKSAVCKFELSQILAPQRTSPSTGRTAAIPTTSQCRQWAVLNSTSDRNLADAAMHPMAAKSPDFSDSASRRMSAMLVRTGEKAVNERLNIDLLLACFKKVVIEDWCDQSEAHSFSIGL